ncbi:MAG: DUF1015 domain-containing protein, partial [Flavobacteriales bacterium]
MAQLNPFKGIRPPKHLAHLVASRSYLEYSPEDLKSKLKGNPFTFLHIIHPENHLEKSKRVQGHEKFEKVREKFQNFCEQQWLEKDNITHFYLYRQSHAEKSFLGLIAGVSVNEYIKGNIKKHEATLPKKEELFSNYLNICGFNAEPVLLTYPDREEINACFESYTAKDPDYDFSTTNKDRHELWLIDKPEELKKIEGFFADIPSLYIADGHHRSASSSKLYQDHYARQKDHPTAFYMACLIPESQLKISAFNRIIYCDFELNEDDLMSKLKTHFEVKSIQNPEKELGENSMRMLFRTQWFDLHLKSETYKINSPVDKLDAELLSKTILEPIL